MTDAFTVGVGLVDSTDQADLDRIRFSVDGRAATASVAAVRPLTTTSARSDDVAELVDWAGLSHTLDGHRAPNGLDVGVADADLADGTAVEVVLAIGELQPGRYVATLLGHGALGATGRLQPTGYARLVPSVDPVIIGPGYPQLSGFHDPPDPAIHSDRRYSRRWREPLPPEVRLDLFALRSSARWTDLLSAGPLDSSGLHASPTLAASIAALDVPDAVMHASVVTGEDDRRERVFVQLLDTDVVDFERSDFRNSVGMNGEVDEPVSIDGHDAIAAQRSINTRHPMRPGLVAERLRLRRLADLFAVPGSIEYAISMRAARRFEADGITGCTFAPLSTRLA